MITTNQPPAVGSANSGPSGRAPTSAACRRSPVAEVAEVAAAEVPVAPGVPVVPVDRRQTRLGADDVDEEVGRVPAVTSVPPSCCSWTSNPATGTS